MSEGNGESRFLSPAEVAAGVGVRTTTVHEWIRRGELKAVRLGGRILRVSRADLDEWLASNVVGASR